MHSQQISDFQLVVYEYYQQYGRKLPWRIAKPDGSFDPYKIMLSEIMLQQTQVNRVKEKYGQFLTIFPDLQTLAAASLSSVLITWSGLGYNRRAKYLHQSAQMIDARGSFPRTLVELQKLPGIGYNTAAAIMNYTYNLPVPFIETNIRTVYIHYFFPGKRQISDKELLPLVAATMDRDNPREFFWAIMDYGTFLKQTEGNVSRRSAHYAKQSVFEGSVRQVRGKILRRLALRPHSAAELFSAVPDERCEQVIGTLISEGLVVSKNGLFALP